MHNIYDIQIPTQYGNILTRLFQPLKSPPATLFYIHGGGFILGNLQTHDRIMRLLACYSGCTVIGIDYSLSPEARYPQAIEEISTVYQYYQQMPQSIISICNKLALQVTQLAQCYLLLLYFGCVITL